MPLYGFKCSCGEEQDVVLSISERNTVQACNECGAVLCRVISCNIERVEPVYLDEMKQMLPVKERARVNDRHSFKRALDRSGLITI